MKSEITQNFVIIEPTVYITAITHRNQEIGLEIRYNVRLNLADFLAKVILIGHWYDHKKKLSHTFFAVTKSNCKFTQFAFCNKIYEAF